MARRADQRSPVTMPRPGLRYQAARGDQQHRRTPPRCASPRRPGHPPGLDGRGRRAAYMSSSAKRGLGVPEAGVPPLRLNSSLREKTGFLLCIGSSGISRRSRTAPRAPLYQGNAQRALRSRHVGNDGASSTARPCGRGRTGTKGATMTGQTRPVDGRAAAARGCRSAARRVPVHAQIEQWFMRRSRPGLRPGDRCRRSRALPALWGEPDDLRQRSAPGGARRAGTHPRAQRRHLHRRAEAGVRPERGDRLTEQLRRPGCAPAPDRAGETVRQGRRWWQRGSSRGSRCTPSSGADRAPAAVAWSCRTSGEAFPELFLSSRSAARCTRCCAAGTAPSRGRPRSTSSRWWPASTRPGCSPSSPARR